MVKFMQLAQDVFVVIFRYRAEFLKPTKLIIWTSNLYLFVNELCQVSE